MSAPADTLVAEIDALHEHYVVAVNEAVADDDTDRVARLAAAYDRDATALIAAREGRTAALPRARRGVRRRLGRRAERAA